MFLTDATSALADAAVFVDLIGDLDATLGSQFAATLADLTAGGTRAVYLTTKHVNISSVDGLAAVDAALSAARAGGCAVAVEPGSRKMRSAFASARISCVDDAPSRPPRGRHLMIARHAAPVRSGTA